MVSTVIKRVELLANIALIILAICVGVVVVKKYVLASHSESTLDKISPGSQISLPNMDWAKNGQTLLIVLQKGCHFCSESAQFYQRIVHETNEPGSVQLVAVLPQDTETGRKYLDELNIPIENIMQASLRSIQVKGTPTLILVNDKGEVVESWVGKLPVDKESEVLNRLRAKV